MAPVSAWQCVEGKHLFEMTSTYVLFSSVGRCFWEPSRKAGQSRGRRTSRNIAEGRENPGQCLPQLRGSGRRYSFPRSTIAFPTGAVPGGFRTRGDC